MHWKCTKVDRVLLLVGPNGDGFGGQAFMEHYNDLLVSAYPYLPGLLGCFL
jgi:hypothetical protein